MRILRNFCIACVRLYQLVFAPLFMSLGVQCKFSPSCSNYALQAFQIHGPIRAAALSFCRLMRCHPFCCGGIDPVPLGSERRTLTNG